MKKVDLERLTRRGLSQHEIAAELGHSQSNVRYWLKKHGLKTRRMVGTTLQRLILPKAKLEPAVAANCCMADCLRALELPVVPTYYNAVGRKITNYGLDTSHWVKNGRKGGRCRPLNEVMVKGSDYHRGNLKRRLLTEGILDNRCAWCGQGTEWNGKPIVLVLDHINGVRNDHRLKNLRMLCPNCNSQTPTFSGRNNS